MAEENTVSEFKPIDGSGVELAESTPSEPASYEYIITKAAEKDTDSDCKSMPPLIPVDECSNWFTYYQKENFKPFISQYENIQKHTEVVNGRTYVLYEDMTTCSSLELVFFESGTEKYVSINKHIITYSDFELIKSVQSLNVTEKDGGKVRELRKDYIAELVEIDFYSRDKIIVEASPQLLVRALSEKHFVVDDVKKEELKGVEKTQSNTNDLTMGAFFGSVATIIFSILSLGLYWQVSA